MFRQRRLLYHAYQVMSIVFDQLTMKKAGIKKDEQIQNHVYFVPFFMDSI